MGQGRAGGKGKQGRNHPGQGLCGPYQELGTGHICSKSGSPWPRRGLMPLQPNKCHVGCRRAQERSVREVPRLYSTQPSSACC
ncbi:hypothetical protein MC885_013203 [Smutsia gigantea]|nr:hypothetical protein MC885_013203 [Smutsia gigantea]